MIELRRNCLLLVQENGEAIPCSAEDLAFEIVGPGHVSNEVLRQCAAGVLHYFKQDLGRSRITFDEFSRALVRVLAGLGFQVEVTDPSTPQGASEGHDSQPVIPPDARGPVNPPVRRLDLSGIAADVNKLGELEFFPRLRSLLDEGLTSGACTVDCHGLRSAVKSLLGRKQWTPACRELEQRIVESLRRWCRSRAGSGPAGLVVR
ncbi:MAG: hypothetical protein WCR07_16025 [Verrucomicrobiota bacterium]|jgi:hypothetical protein